MCASLLSNSIWTLCKSSFFNYEDKNKNRKYHHVLHTGRMKTVSGSFEVHIELQWAVFSLRWLCFQRNLVVPSSGKRRIFSWSNYNSFQSLPQERRRESSRVDRSVPHHLFDQAYSQHTRLFTTHGRWGRKRRLIKGRKMSVRFRDLQVTNVRLTKRTGIFTQRNTYWPPVHRIHELQGFFFFFNKKVLLRFFWSSDSHSVSLDIGSFIWLGSEGIKT